jgi:hypothetical protein
VTNEIGCLTGAPLGDILEPLITPPAWPMNWAPT